MLGQSKYLASWTTRLPRYVFGESVGLCVGFLLVGGRGWLVGSSVALIFACFGWPRLARHGSVCLLVALLVYVLPGYWLAGFGCEACWCFWFHRLAAGVLVGRAVGWFVGSVSTRASSFFLSFIHSFFLSFV